MQGRYRNGIPEDERRRLIGCAFSTAIVAAPFLALLVSVRAGLLVLVLALATAGWFAFEASEGAANPYRKWLRLLAIANALFLIVALGALLLTVT